MLRIVLLGTLVLGGAALLVLEDWESSSTSEEAAQTGAGLDAEGGPTLGTNVRKKPGPEGLVLEREAARNLFNDLRQMSAKAQAELLQTRLNASPMSAVPFSDDLARLILEFLLSGDRFQMEIAAGFIGRMGARAAPFMNVALAGEASLVAKRRMLQIMRRWRVEGQTFELPDLLPLLDEEHAPLRQNTYALIRSGVPYEPKLAERLLELLRERPSQGFGGPAPGLALMGPEGIALLADLIQSGEFEEKRAALGGLVYADKEHLRPLLPMLAERIADPEGEPGLRSSAIHALRAMHGDCVECLPALRSALADESYELIYPCLFVLKQMAAQAAPAVPDLLRWLQESDDRVANATASALGVIAARPDIVLPALSEMILKRASDEAARAMGAFGSRALPQALQVLEEGDEYAQYSILWAFAGMGEGAAPAVPRLIALISGEDADVSQRAVGTLGYIGSQAKDAVPAIMKRMALGESTLSARTAAGTLVRLGEPAEEALVQALRSKDKTLRRQAAKTLTHFHLRSAFALDALASLTRSKDVQLRRDAFAAVGTAVVDVRTMMLPTEHVADEATLRQVRRILEPALKDKDESIRQRATWEVAAIDSILSSR